MMASKCSHQSMHHSQVFLLSLFIPHIFTFHFSNVYFPLPLAFSHSQSEIQLSIFNFISLPLWEGPGVGLQFSTVLVSSVTPELLTLLNSLFSTFNYQLVQLTINFKLSTINFIPLPLWEGPGLGYSFSFWQTDESSHRRR